MERTRHHDEHVHREKQIILGRRENHKSVDAMERGGQGLLNPLENVLSHTSLLSTACSNIIIILAICDVHTLSFPEYINCHVTGREGHMRQNNMVE
jgi:hypothetical protein